MKAEDFQTLVEDTENFCWDHGRQTFRVVERDGKICLLLDDLISLRSATTVAVPSTMRTTVNCVSNVRRHWMFRVIVAGGRDFGDFELLYRKLDTYLANKLPEVTIVSGMARGADTLGVRYAQDRGLDVAKFPAEWERYGKSAGYIRNQEMAKEADALIAFWDGRSRGTKHMIDIATERGLLVKVVRY